MIIHDGSCPNCGAPFRAVVNECEDESCPAESHTWEIDECAGCGRTVFFRFTADGEGSLFVLNHLTH